MSNLFVLFYFKEVEMANISKGDIIDILSAKNGVSKANCTRMVNSFIDTITDALKRGDEVRIMGFGTFSVAHRSERTGRSPRTGEVLTIPASKYPKFKPSKILKSTIS